MAHVFGCLSGGCVNLILPECAHRPVKFDQKWIHAASLSTCVWNLFLVPISHQWNVLQASREQGSVLFSFWYYAWARGSVAHMYRGVTTFTQSHAPSRIVVPLPYTLDPKPPNPKAKIFSKKKRKKLAHTEIRTWNVRVHLSTGPP